MTKRLNFENYACDGCLVSWTMSVIVSCLVLLQRYQRKGNKFLDQIITGNETWVHHYTPLTKRDTQVWKRKDSLKPKKFNTTPSAWKVMATVLFEGVGVIHVEFMPKGTTINADAYCNTLKRLRTAVKNKRPGMLSKSVVLLQDNAIPHSINKKRRIYWNRSNVTFLTIHFIVPTSLHATITCSGWWCDI